MDTDYPVLAIFMRNDLWSLNPGKACAQASHAANQMESEVVARKDIVPIFKKWKKAADGFGTALVFADSWEKISDRIDWARHEKPSKIVVGEVLDPTYPLRDGSVTHLIPLYTCAWMFGMKSEVSKFTDGFSLMK